MLPIVLTCAHQKQMSVETWVWVGAQASDLAVQMCIGGQKPQMPTDVPPALHSMLAQCFQQNPNLRPTAMEVLRVTQPSG